MARRLIKCLQQITAQVSSLSYCAQLPYLVMGTDQGAFTINDFPEDFSGKELLMVIEFSSSAQ